MRASLWVLGVSCLLPAVAAQADTIDVFVVDFDYEPDPTINVNDTIRWVWEGAVFFPHSSTSVDGLAESWDSGVESAPFQYEHTFTTPGVYEYYCTLHGADNGDGTAAGMAGVITVVPEPVSAALLAAGALVLLGRRRR